MHIQGGEDQGSGLYTWMLFCGIVEPALVLSSIFFILFPSAPLAHPVEYLKAIEFVADYIHHKYFVNLVFPI
jgi:hypothetical protein